MFYNKKEDYRTRKMHLFFILFFYATTVYGMLSGYNYKDDDFIQYANSFQESKSTCAVVHKNGELSGVLIAENLVITAAHGAVHMGKGSPQQTIIGLVALDAEDVYVIFDNKERIKVEKIYIDARYLMQDKAEYGKYDVAFFKLEKRVKKRKPITLAKKLCVDKNNASFVVISHGMSDQTSFLDFLYKKPYVRRAFALTEWSPFYVNMKSPGNVEFIRSLLYSSIFFDARKTYQENLGIDAENTLQRTMEALKKWYDQDRPPFALALPGTSGAPIFLNNHQELSLLGLVVAYAPIQQNTMLRSDTHQYLLMNPQAAVGNFQTIFCLLYKENVLENTHTHIMLELDPIVQKVLNLVEGVYSF